MRIWKLRGRILGIALALLVGTAAAAEANTWVVNTTDDLDDGTCTAAHCSLREAINAANTNPGADTIIFSIETTDMNFVTPGGGQCDTDSNGIPDAPQCWWTIRLLRDLPTIVDDNTTVDGFAGHADTTPGTVGSGTDPNEDAEARRPGTQPSVCELLTFRKPEIAIDAQKTTLDQFAVPGSVATMSIDGDADFVTIRGLSIYNTLGEHAILGNPGVGTNRTVEENFVGVLPDGGDPGVFRNMHMGVRQLSPGFMDVLKNYVGYNGQGGVDGFASASVLTVRQNEVFENGWDSFDHDGIDINGVNSVCECNLARDNTNVLMIPSGSAGNGIEVGSKEVNTAVLDNNIIRYNTARGNLSSGIAIRKGPRGTFVERNVLYDNQLGIHVETEGRVPTNRNRFSQNSTYRNMGLGIDLQAEGQQAGATVQDGLPYLGFATVPVGTHPAPDGVTPNDHCDVDGGGTDNSIANLASNDLQNYPVITSAMLMGSNTKIDGYLDSTPGRTYRIEFFATPMGMMFMDPGDREGKEYIGSILVTTAIFPSCTANFSATFGPRPEGDLITATATYYTNDGTPWSTSEYSEPESVDKFVPNGKVTGGGWYMQPMAATPAPSGDSRANFGFNAQYHKTDPMPKGHTNFVYKPANLHFGSLDYELASLVVSQNPDGTGWARWRGTGKLNNDPNHCFRAYVEDNNEPGTADEWHIRIWHKSTSGGSCSNESSTPIYDNNPLNPAQGPGVGTVINGGNIQLHRPNP